MRLLENLDFLKRQLDIEFINLLGNDRIEVKFKGDIFIFDYFFNSKTDLVTLSEAIKKDYNDFLRMRKTT